MSAIAAWPLVAERLRAARGLGATDHIDRIAAGHDRRMRRLLWLCGAQLLILLALDVIVYFPELLQIGPRP